MKIKNLFVKNKKIDLREVNLDFSQNGIYIISGENGSGKTTLLEKIIFGNYDVEFLSQEQKYLFEKDRANVFSYIPQKSYQISMQVKEYIYKGNKSIDEKELFSLFEEFGLEKNILNKNLKTLSGGEKKKVSIISGFLKETPYIFLDEPTNNLDDTSVFQLIKLIEKQAKNKSIIIVTHDPRFTFANFISINVTKSVTTFNTHFVSNTTNRGVQTKNKNSSFIVILGLFKNWINILAVLTTFIVVFMLSIYTQMQFENGYSTDELPSKNIILTYKADYVYSDLNKVYVEQEHLNISDENMYSMIGYDDIPQISQIDGVEKILLTDYEYFESLNSKLDSGQLLDSINYISIPNVIAEDFDECISSPYKFDFLEKGRLPKDNMMEVAVSKNNILIKYFGFTDLNVDNAIGKSIYINDNIYKVVGIYYYDFCILSYENGINYGFYSYSSDTYSDFKERNLKYKIQIDGIYLEKTNEVIIFTDNGNEKKVLNYLFNKFPAENYYSYEYVSTWVKGFNSTFINKILFINGLFASLIGIMLIILCKNQYNINKQKIFDYENYYIDRRKIKNLYISFSVLQYIFILAICIFLNHLMNSFYYVSDIIIIINIILISVAVLSYLIYSTYFVKDEGK